MNKHASKPKTWTRVLGFVILFAIGIPWYWRPFHLPPTMAVFGVPAWFATAVVTSLVVSMLVAWHLRLPWESEIASGDEENQS